MLHEHRDRPLTLHFPAGGEVHYTNNRWLRGVGDVTILGGSFRCIANTAWSADKRPFNMTTPFHAAGDVSAGELNRLNLYTTGELLSGANLSAYEGQRVLVYGLETQPGNSFPPNPRHFAFTRVVNGAFDPPLPFEPRDDWPEAHQFIGPTGKPRILSLDREDYRHAGHITVRGSRFLNPVDGSEAGFVVECERLDLEDCWAEGHLWTSLTGSAHLKRVDAASYDLDKMTPFVELDDCIARKGWGESTGVGKIIARGGTFSGDIRPRGPDMEFIGCRFIGNEGDQFGIWRYIDAWAVRRLYFRDCTFDATNSPNLLHAINPGADNSQPHLLPQIEVLEVLPGDAIAVRAVGRWEGLDHTLWSNLMAGQPLMTADGSVRGRVQGLHSDAGGRVLVRATWDDPPQVGAVYQMWLIFGRFDGGGNKVIGRDVPLWRGTFESVEEQHPPGRVILDD